MRISGFVENRGTEKTIGERDLDVKEVDSVRREFRSELDRGVKVVGFSYQAVNVMFGTRRYKDAVINISTIEITPDPRKRLVQGDLQVAHEEASVTRSHFGAHGYAAALLIEFAAEFERIAVKHVFSKAQKNRGRWVKRRSLVQEVFQSFEAILMGDIGIQSRNIHRQEKSRNKGSSRVEFPDLEKSSSAVLDIRREPSNERLKDGIKIGRDVLSRTRDCRYNRSARTIELMDLWKHVKTCLPWIPNVQSNGGGREKRGFDGLRNKLLDIRGISGELRVS